VSALLLLAACVPKGRYELTQVQLEATRLAMDTRVAACAQDQHTAEALRFDLEEEVALRQLQLDELDARCGVVEAEVTALRAERALLLDELVQLRDDLEAARATRRGPPPAPVVLPEVARLAREDVLAKITAHERDRLLHERIESANAGTREAFAELVEQGRVAVAEAPTGEAVVVTIPSGLLFQEGFATLSPRGQELVEAVGRALERVPGRAVVVLGHTDDRKAHSADFPSNWERAFTYALAVVRGLQGAGTPASFTAASAGESAPAAPNEEAAGRKANERVELWIRLDPLLTTRFAPTPPEAPAPEEPVEP
jgi:flagellar motor protein MotB